MPRDPWFRAGFDAWSLGVEASSVIALRTLKILAGGAAAETEARRMVSEKIETGLALQALALTGALGVTARRAATKTIAHYPLRKDACRGSRVAQFRVLRQGCEASCGTSRQCADRAGQEPPPSRRCRKN
jgi:hypothetical protein